jgi:hypothetical protein
MAYKNEAAYALGEFMKTLRALKLTKYREYGLAGVRLANTYIGHGLKGRQERKPRTTSHDMGRDTTWWPDTIAKKKIEKRLQLGQCRGCGNKPDECRCRRKR